MRGDRNQTPRPSPLPDNRQSQRAVCAWQKSPSRPDADGANGVSHARVAAAAGPDRGSSAALKMLDLQAPPGQFRSSEATDITARAAIVSEHVRARLRRVNIGQWRHGRARLNRGGEERHRTESVVTPRRRCSKLRAKPALPSRHNTLSDQPPVAVCLYSASWLHQDPLHRSLASPSWARGLPPSIRRRRADCCRGMRDPAPLPCERRDAGDGHLRAVVCDQKLTCNCAIARSSTRDWRTWYSNPSFTLGRTRY